MSLLRFIALLSVLVLATAGAVGLWGLDVSAELNVCVEWLEGWTAHTDGPVLAAPPPVVQRIVLDLRGEEEVKSAGESVGGIGKGADKAKKGIGGLGESFKKLATGAFIVAGITLALNKLRQAILGASKRLVEFRGNMFEVSTLVDTTTTNMGALSRDLLALSARRPVDQGLLGKALYQTISAGIVDAAEALDVLDVASRAAVGGVTEVNVAVDGLTSALNGFELSADMAGDVADQFFVAVKRGKTTFGEIASNIGIVAAMAQEAGVSLEQVLSGMAAITLTGQTTSLAITQLSAIFTAAQRNAKNFAAIGIDINRSLSEQGLLGTLQDIRKAADESNISLVSLFGRVEGAKATLTLTGAQQAAFVSILDDMANRAGAADEAYNKMAFSLDTLTVTLGNRFNQFMFGVMIPALESLEMLLRKIEVASRDVQGAADRIDALRTSVGQLAEAEAAIDTFNRLTNQTSLTEQETVELDKATLLLTTTYGSFINQVDDAGQALSFYTERLKDNIRAQRAFARDEIADQLDKIIKNYERLRRAEVRLIGRRAELDASITEQKVAMQELIDRLLDWQQVDVGMRQQLEFDIQTFEDWGGQLQTTRQLIENNEEAIRGLFQEQGRFNMDRFIAAAVDAGRSAEEAAALALNFAEALGLLKLQQDKFDNLGAPENTRTVILQSMAERIKLLEQEKEELLAVGEATERLAEVNRQLFALQKQAATLATFGLVDPAVAKKQAAELKKAKELLTEMNEAIMLAANLTDDQAAALTSVLSIKKQIAAAAVLEAQHGADFSIEVEGQMVTLRTIQRQLEKRLATEQEVLETANAFARAIANAKNNLEGLVALGPDLGAGFLPFLDEAERIEKITMRLDAFNKAVIDLKNQRVTGAIGDDLFNEQMAALAKSFMDDMSELFRMMEQFKLITPAVARAFQSFFSRVQGSADKTAKSTADIADNLKNMGRAVRGVRQLLNVFGDLSDEANNVLDGIASILDNAGALSALPAGAGGLAAALPVLGIAAGTATLLSGLLGDSAAEQEETRQAMAELAQALRQNARDITDAVEAMTESARIGQDLSGEQIDAAREAERTFLAGLQPPTGGDPRAGFPGRTPAGQRQLFLGFLDALEDAGIDIEAFRERFLLLIQQGTPIGEAINQIFAGGLRNVLDLVVRDVITFGQSVDGAVASMEFMRRFFEHEFPQAFMGFLDFLLKNVTGLSNVARDLLEEALSLDLSTEAGRQRAKEIGQAFVQAILDGDLDFLAGLSAEDAEKIAAIFLQSSREGAADTVGDDAQTTLQFQRVVTAVQGSGILLELKNITFYVRRIAESVTSAGTSGPLTGLALTAAPVVPPPFPVGMPVRRVVTGGGAFSFTMGDLVRPLNDAGDDAAVIGQMVEREIRKTGYSAIP